MVKATLMDFVEKMEIRGNNRFLLIINIMIFYNDLKR